MKMHVLEIPDQPKERALWLEEQIVGLDLAAVVTELYTLGEGEPLPEETLEQLLGRPLGSHCARPNAALWGGVLLRACGSAVDQRILHIGPTGLSHRAP
jgi:hypothetical protein